MLPRFGLALLLSCAGVTQGVADDPLRAGIPDCAREQPPIIAACRMPPPPGATAPFVPGASLCRLTDGRLQVNSCVILPGTTTIPSGGMVFLANFGLFVRDPANSQGRLYDAPGQRRICTGADPKRGCDLLNYGAGAADAGPQGDPSAAGPPRQVVPLGATTASDAPPPEPSTILPLILAQLVVSCARSTPATCTGATSQPSRSFSLPIAVPAR